MKALTWLGCFILCASNVACAQPSRDGWISVEDCRDVATDQASSDTEADATAPDATEEVVRVGSWNLRWFPRGCSNRDGCANPPDLNMVACAVATLDVDVLAVQEVVDYPSDRALVAEFLASLERITGEPWRLDLQDCGAPNSQRVGLLWRPERVRLTGFSDVAALNGAARHEGEPCAGGLRPGRHAYAESLAGGADFHLVVVHLDSGVREKDWNTRRAAIRALPDLQSSPALSGQRDSDVVVLGDFNVMGRTEGARVDGPQELAIIDETIGPRFRRLDSEPSCSYRYRGRPTLMDLVLVSSDMAEANAAARPGGWCALTGCRDGWRAPPNATQLSDHCPVVVDVLDQDLDHDLD